MRRFVHARDVSDLGEVMELVCYIVPHFTRHYAFDNSPCKLCTCGSSAELFTHFCIAFLRNDLVEISRWAAETRPCGPDALKGLIEDLHREVLRIIEVQSLSL
jgi:hypothetical protein